MKRFSIVILGVIVAVIAGLPLQVVADQPIRSEDGKAWMEVDTLNNVLIGYYEAGDYFFVDTLACDGPALEFYPKQVHSIEASDGSTIYLFIYSQGHLLFYDEAQTCIVDEHGLRPSTLFLYDGERDCRVGCMWYDQLVAASDGFPFEDEYDDRFGIHYDRSSKSLYVPIMEHHEKGSGYENCLRYTGRYDVLRFNGKDFVLTDNDGAWWLHPNLRNYKRTISNRKTAGGYEQVDLMPDGTYRRSFWKGAKTLDDLRKKPSF